MSLFKNIKKAAGAILPSPIQIDFEKGGSRRVAEVAPYPKEVFWDDTVPVYLIEGGIEYVRTPEHGVHLQLSCEMNVGGKNHSYPMTILT